MINTIHELANLDDLAAIHARCLRRMHMCVEAMQAREAGQRDLFEGPAVPAASGGVDVEKALDLVGHLELAIPTGNKKPIAKLIAQLREVLTAEATPNGASATPNVANATPIAAASGRQLTGKLRGQLVLDLE